MREGKGDSQWWNVITLVLVSLVRGKDKRLKLASSYLNQQTDANWNRIPRKGNAHNTKLPWGLQVHDMHCYQSLHAATRTFLLVLNDHIPLRNSEWLFLREICL